MAKIKSGAEIKEVCDVQNIVTAYILRSARPFTRDEMIITVENACEGSSIKITRDQIKELVQGTIMAFLRHNLLDTCNGKYYAYPCDYREALNKTNNG